ncbi:MAG TPA: hypothetical protein VK168_06555 [Saprospiraceae bacterium]|nr:hypothetical protein [Saprospiraceae bacterium]
MAIEKVSEQARRHIRENDQRAAADLLMQAFRDKNQQLFNIAVVQQANIKKLADQSAAGILSVDEINREQAKTNAALLHLSDEYARLFEAQSAPKAAIGLPLWAYGAAAAVVAIIVIGWLLSNSAPAPETFALEVYLHEAGAEEKAIRDGQVNLRLGETILQSKLPLDAEGRATFKELSAKFKADSVHLLYFPSTSQRFTVKSQSAATLSGTNQSIRFALEFVPDTTQFSLTIQDAKGRAIQDAEITIDGNLHTKTDAKGYFQIPVAKAVGSTILLVIESKGKRIFSQDVALTSRHTILPIE